MLSLRDLRFTKHKYVWWEIILCRPTSDIITSGFDSHECSHTVFLASAAVGITVPAADIQQRGRFIWYSWRRISEQAGPHQSLQRQSKGACPQEEAASAVQLRSRCCHQEQRRKTDGDKAVRRIPTENTRTSIKQQTVQRPANCSLVVTPVQLVACTSTCTVQVKLPVRFSDTLIHQLIHRTQCVQYFTVCS